VARRAKFLDGLFLSVAALVLALDQVTKQVVVTTLGPDAPRHSVEVIGEFFRFTYVTNSGAAFGMFQGQTSIFAVIAFLAIPILIYLNATFERPMWLTRVCLGMLLGGAVGNLVDRLRYGHVIDFVDVGIGTLRWPAFNVADSSFVVGIFILAIYLILNDRPTEETDSNYATK
jgi:signal peptidase II